MNSVKCEDTKEIVSNYKDYLKTRHWYNFRQKFLKYQIEIRGELRCEICLEKGRFNVHHRSYDRLGKEIYDDVIILCKHCHCRLHLLLKEIKSLHPGRSLLSVTNRCIKSTRLGKNSKYNFFLKKYSL